MPEKMCKKKHLTSFQLIILGFAGVILLGSILLMLPVSSLDKVPTPFHEALFTATSAVCVTGLVVKDSGSYWSVFGQTVILALIQIGGFGVVTVAAAVSLLSGKKISLMQRSTMQDAISAPKVGGIVRLTRFILKGTLLIEAAGAMLLLPVFVSDYGLKGIWMAAFHSVSAFCNAGFSTLSNSLYESDFRYNYYLQLVIMLTFVLGGLGFPIVVNILRFIRYKLITLISVGKPIYRPWVLNLNSRITLITTLSISLVAFIIFYFLEYNNTLAEHNGLGKAVTALFGATTPRTAGFNSIDTAALSLPTLMMVFLLMWIGASPQSTGGGIKTSTFAIATLNILSLAKGKSRIEIFRREIADISVRRAFAIISLSLIVIGFSIMAISATDPEKQLISIAFECFSAYSTVGLSLGITSALSVYGKIIIIIVMFLGRISMLSFVIAVFRKIKITNYSYPKEEITIN